MFLFQRKAFYFFRVERAQCSNNIIIISKNLVQQVRALVFPQEIKIGPDTRGTV